MLKDQIFEILPTLINTAMGGKMIDKIESKLNLNIFTYVIRNIITHIVSNIFVILQQIWLNNKSGYGYDDM